MAAKVSCLCRQGRGLTGTHEQSMEGVMPADVQQQWAEGQSQKLQGSSAPQPSRVRLAATIMASCVSVTCIATASTCAQRSSQRSCSSQFEASSAEVIETFSASNRTTASATKVQDAGTRAAATAHPTAAQWS